MLSIIFIVTCLATIPVLSINSSSNNPILEKQGFVMNLVHREAIYPTIYPKGSTLLDRVGLALSSRVVRRSSIHNTNMNQTSYHEKAIGKIKTKGSSFFTEIFIGSMFVRQYVTFDTASSLLWVQCNGYSKGHKTENFVYDPRLSRSYRNSTCSTTGHWYCKIIPGGGCDNYDRCKYYVEFEDDSYSKGYLGFETITLDRNHPTSQVHNVLFGCGMDNHDTKTLHKEDGVFGLGALWELSILRLTKKKFSFCYGSINDQNYQYNHIALGDDAKIIGDHPVQFTTKETHHGYLVKLNSITIGGHKVEGRNLKMLIDTGSTFSFVNEDIQLLIIHLIETEMKGRMQKTHVKNMPDALCYKGSAIPKPFAPMNIVLGPHTTIQLDGDAQFWKIPQTNAFCMIFRKAAHEDDNTIGESAMQHHNVAFDLNTNRVYFKKTDCVSPR